MTLWRLITKEIRYRKLNFALAVLSVLAAVACLVAMVTLLRVHDLRTEQLIQAKIAETAEKVRARQALSDKMAADLEEAYRKIMLQFGYDLLILPAEEKLLDYQVRGGPSKYMDEDYVRILSESGIMTVRHLLPILQQKQVLIFGDNRQEVFLIGTRGEVPLAHRTPKRAILSAVPRGEMIVGHDIHHELGVNVGDSVKVVDQQFKVVKAYGPRDPNNDASVWIDLKQAQELFGKKGKINGIFALSCVCPRSELMRIKEHIQKILPGTQVRVMTSNAVIRYESRARAAEEASARVELVRRQGREDILREGDARARLKAEIETFSSWVIPLILVGSAVWMALLAFGNVRRRRREIGVLRALGLRSRQIFTIFLGKAAFTGLLGACAGYACGFLVVWAWQEAPPAGKIFDPLLLGVALLLAPALSCLAGWAPAVIAARQDPAVVLQEE